MCLKPGIFPLIKDTYTEKRYISFSFPYVFNDINEYKDLCKLSIDRVNKYVKTMTHNPLTKDEIIEKMVFVPCGQCPECFNNRAKNITFRIMQEAKEHSSNYFITLTYDETNLPENYSLIKDEISKFNKKLKVYLSRNNMKSDFRFYGVGEYGSKTARPHYHVIYFGLELNDLTYHSTTANGDILYNSKFLESIWNKGFVVIGEVTPASAAYVARYCEKKKLLTKQEKKQFLEAGFVPEFSVQSMRPGIGANFLEKSVVSIFNKCYNFNIKGSSYALPKYYRDKVKKIMVDSPELSSYEDYLSSVCSSGVSGDYLYFGKDLQSYNNNELLSRLKSKAKRKSL